MKQILFVFVLIFSSNIYALEADLLPVAIDVQDKNALQRGARMYMNYCSGCHSLKYMRYNRMARDLGLTTFTGEIDKELLKSNLIFTSSGLYSPIEISMPEVDARQWFGRLPPDLSLSARERGPDWIYTYLKTFYADDKRPFGANNLLVPDVSMPNILAPLSGNIVALNNNKLVLLERGLMTQHQFDSALVDLVTFLTYVSEPAQLVRYSMGVWVLAFLFVFLIFAYLLKKHYWRDVLKK